jgi:hypothetical protein
MTGHHGVLLCHFDCVLIVLSVATAMLSTYATLDLRGRVTYTRGALGSLRLICSAIASAAGEITADLERISASGALQTAEPRILNLEKQLIRTIESLDTLCQETVP